MVIFSSLISIKDNLRILMIRSHRESSNKITGTGLRNPRLFIIKVKQVSLRKRGTLQRDTTMGESSSQEAILLKMEDLLPEEECLTKVASLRRDSAKEMALTGGNREVSPHHSQPMEEVSLKFKTPDHSKEGSKMMMKSIGQIEVDRFSTSQTDFPQDHSKVESTTKRDNQELSLVDSSSSIMNLSTRVQCKADPPTRTSMRDPTIRTIRTPKAETDTSTKERDR